VVLPSAVGCIIAAHLPHASTRAVWALPPNKRFQPTPLRVERDRRFFGSSFRSDCFSDLSRRRG
jgi:hypothetical protein